MRDTVQNIIEKEFDREADNYKEIVGGLNSHTYKVVIDGQSYILQINDVSEPHELENCVKCFRFLQESEVPVPKVISGVKEFDDSHYTIVKFVEGEALGDDFSREETIESGKLLAKIHDYRSFENTGWWEWKNREPKVTGFPGNSLKSRIKQLMMERKGFFHEQGLEELEKITEKFLENHLEKVPEDFEPVFVHHDFNPGNTLSKEGAITAILDFDYAHSSHAQRDLAKASNKFWLRGGKRKNLYKGYREVRDLGDSFEQNKLIYQLESLLNEIAAMLEHQHITKEEALDYIDELERIESKIIFLGSRRKTVN